MAEPSVYLTGENTGCIVNADRRLGTYWNSRKNQIPVVGIRPFGKFPLVFALAGVWSSMLQLGRIKSELRQECWRCRLKT
jgi:hypothetical protein